MEAVEQFVHSVGELVWSSGITVGGATIPFIVMALLGTGVYLTLRLGFVQFRRLGHGAAVATGRYDDPDDPGDVSHFQALSTALSATVGIGNIAGVALAIHWGGPGALFWMWITALLGMATKFAEVTLAQKYRTVEGDSVGGTVAGGPMYYIEKGLGRAWRPLAVAFAVALGVSAFLTGNGVQANTLADTMETSFGVAPWITGLVSAATVGAVIIGGIRRIGRVTAILAPLMAIIYVSGALVIIVLNFGDVGPALVLVVREAFNPTAGVAGTGAGAIVITMMWGVKRGLFSNEAGQGSAPIAHAAAKTDEPVSEGVVALLEPFIDTILICSMTGLVIIMTGVWQERVPTELALDSGDLSWVVTDAEGVLAADTTPPASVMVEGGTIAHERSEGTALAWHGAPVEVLFVDPEHLHPFSGRIDTGTKTAVTRDGETLTRLWGDATENGAPLTMMAFSRGLSKVTDDGDKIVLLCVVLFGVSTAISWSYYGDRCARYVLGPVAVVPYRAVFVLMHFLGAVVPLSLAWTLGDVLMGFVIIPNLIALVLLAPQVVEESRKYFAGRSWERSGPGARRGEGT